MPVLQEPSMGFLILENQAQGAYHFPGFSISVGHYETDF